jgi:hypothetical protein
MKQFTKLFLWQLVQNAPIIVALVVSADLLEQGQWLAVIGWMLTGSGMTTALIALAETWHGRRETREMMATNFLIMFASGIVVDYTLRWDIFNALMIGFIIGVMLAIGQIFADVRARPIHSDEVTNWRSIGLYGVVSGLTVSGLNELHRLQWPSWLIAGVLLVLASLLLTWLSVVSSRAKVAIGDSNVKVNANTAD